MDCEVPGTQVSAYGDWSQPCGEQLPFGNVERPCAAGPADMDRARNHRLSQIDGAANVIAICDIGKIAYGLLPQPRERLRPAADDDDVTLTVFSARMLGWLGWLGWR